MLKKKLIPVNTKLHETNSSVDKCIKSNVKYINQVLKSDKKYLFRLKFVPKL